jgi:hypothetical protein
MNKVPLRLSGVIQSQSQMVDLPVITVTGCHCEFVTTVVFVNTPQQTGKKSTKVEGPPPLFNQPPQGTRNNLLLYLACRAPDFEEQPPRAARACVQCLPSQAQAGAAVCAAFLSGPRILEL